MADASHFKTKGVTVVRRIFICGALGFGLCLRFVGTVHAVSIEELPLWVRQSIHPVYIDWAEVYPGLELDAALAPIEAGHPQTLDAAPLVGEPRLEPIEATGEAGGLLSAILPDAAPLVSEPRLEPIEATGEARGLLSAILPDPAPLHGGVLSILATGKDLIQQGKLNEETFPEWFAEHNIDQAALIDVLDGIPLSHPMDPIYLPICAVLWEQIGDDIEVYLGFPPRARITMGIYLGVLEREEDAKGLFASVPPADQKEICSGVAMYHVACELLRYRDKSPRLCIWAWKRGAEMQGAADQAFVCFHIMQACKKLGEPQVVREELIPWAEEALARPGSESRWRYALAELIWAYEYVGAQEKGILRSRYWLEEARERGISPESLVRPKSLLSEIYVKSGRVHEAAAILRDIIKSCPPDYVPAHVAQVRLLELGAVHSDIGDIEVLPPRFKAVRPDKVIVELGLDKVHVVRVTVTGNPTLRITQTESSLGSVRIRTDQQWISMRATYELGVVVGPYREIGTHRGKVRIRLNDSAKPKILLPINVNVVRRDRQRHDE